MFTVSALLLIGSTKERCIILKIYMFKEILLALVLLCQICLIIRTNLIYKKN